MENQGINKVEVKEFKLEHLLLEIIMWCVVYKVLFINAVRPFICKIFSKTKSFNDIKMRNGQMLRNMADEVPFTLTISTHHFIG